MIPRALKPHFTIRHGLLRTVKTDRLIGDRKRTPTTISHCEGALLSGDLDVSRPRPVMAAKGLAAARRSDEVSRRTEVLGWRPPPAGK